MSPAIAWIRKYYIEGENNEENREDKALAQGREGEYVIPKSIERDVPVQRVTIQT